MEDVTSHLMRHLSYHPMLRTCSSDTILRAIKELTQDNISYTSDQGKIYDFNTADKLNALLIKALISTGELNEVESYGVDFDHQFLETEKYDAKTDIKVLPVHPINKGTFSRKRLQERMQSFARTNAKLCVGRCKALRGQMQSFASEMGKTGTEIVSPILDKRKGRN